MNTNIESNGLTSQDIISSQNKYFSHLLKHKQLYLLIILIIVLGIPIISNYIQNKPLIMGEESYYHLYQTQQITWRNLYYLPLKIYVLIFSEQLLFLIPLSLAILSLLLFLKLAKKIELTDEFTLIFSAFLITTPAFILTFITISSYSLFFFLMVLGVLLLSYKSKISKYLSIAIFVSATFIGTFSSIFALLLQVVYFRYRRQESKTIPFVVIVVTLLFTTLNMLLFKSPFLSPVFYSQNYLANLISDLGGLSGIPLFAFLLALMGLIYTWKEIKYHFCYLFLLLSTIGYLYNTESVFMLALIATFFAAVGFTKLFESRWILDSLKQFTALLLILGLLFSTLTYLNRVTSIDPSKSDAETLSWIKENIPEDKIIFSTSDKDYYIKYFANKQPLPETELVNNENQEISRVNLTEVILTSTYASTTFPLLEKNNISIMYITPYIKQKYPSDQGLLFLLKNEKFKLVHSHEDTEVWLFQE